MGDKIYHYTSEDKLIKIVETMSLRFNTMENTNDPRETLSPDIGYHFKHFYSVLFDEWLNIERYKYKILCFTDDNENEGYEKPRMWSQYGGDHKGCCLVIDKKKFEKELECAGVDVFKREIAYVNKDILDEGLKQLSNETMEHYFRRNIGYFCFTKHSDWMNEKEYRYVIKSQQEVFVPITHSLAEIYVSYKMPNMILEKMIEVLCPETTVKVIRWENGFANIAKTYHSYQECLLERAERILYDIFLRYVFTNSSCNELSLGQLIENYKGIKYPTAIIRNLIEPTIEEYESIVSSKDAGKIMEAIKVWPKRTEIYDSNYN